METATKTTTKWVLDPTHSELTFKVKHMMITNVKGAFKNFSIEVDGEDIFKSNVNVIIDEYELKGILTIKGVSKEVTLDVEFGGISKDPWGNEKAGLSISGKINRKDWGLNWNAALETGGVLVSEDVRISGEIQFVKQS